MVIVESCVVIQTRVRATHIRFLKVTTLKTDFHFMGTLNPSRAATRSKSDRKAPVTHATTMRERKRFRRSHELMPEEVICVAPQLQRAQSVLTGSKRRLINTVCQRSRRLLRLRCFHNKRSSPVCTFTSNYGKLRVTRT